MTEAEKQRADSITEMHFQRAWMQHLLDHKETEAALATRFFLAGIDAATEMAGKIIEEHRQRMETQAGPRRPVRATEQGQSWRAD